MRASSGGQLLVRPVFIGGPNICTQSSAADPQAFFNGVAPSNSPSIARCQSGRSRSRGERRRRVCPHPRHIYPGVSPKGEPRRILRRNITSNLEISRNWDA
jgi:hypothetical protein